MPKTKLQLTNFRSYAHDKFELSPSLTLIVGPNGSGKTNLLESLYALALTKSFRAKDRDLVRFGADFFRVELDTADGKIALAYAAQGGKTIKRAFHDQVASTLVGHIGKLHVSLFEPNDLTLVSGPPEKRRQFLDYILSQTDRAYFKTLVTYRRVLKQRNALLNRFEINRSRDQFFAWDLKLTELATEIHSRRLDLIKFINARLSELYKQIAGSAAAISLHYIASVHSGDYAEHFLDALTRNLMNDLAAGFTTIGPHREDFGSEFNGSPAANVASRGEIRTFVLALKLAEIAYIEEIAGARPTLLLDDVFSELDQSRRHFLVNALKGYQAVITSTEISVLKKLLPGGYQLIETAQAGQNVRR